MIGKIKNLFKTIIVRVFYNLDVDYSTWIFSSSFNTKFNYNSKYLFEYVLENEPTIKPLYIINDEKERKKLQHKYGDKYFIESESIVGIKKVLKSGVWLTSAGMPIYGLGLNKNRFIINLWHGVPLKKIGVMENKLNILTKIYFKHLFSNNYTYVLTTSSNLTQIMMKSFQVEEDKIKVWGQPRNDALFLENDRVSLLDSLYDCLPKYENIILYAPTFRESKNTQFFPFSDFDIKDLNQYLEEYKTLIFIRCHQSEIKKIDFDYGERVRFINSDLVPEIMDVINIFDLLITDYSSMYIDYLLLQKPIIFLPYDKEEYLIERGLNFNYDEVTPGPKPDNYSSFKFEINKLLSDSDYYKKDRERVNNFFNSINNACSDSICKSLKEEFHTKKYIK